MRTLIDEIIDIDKSAREQVEKAQKAAEAMIENAGQKKEKIFAENKERAQNRIKLANSSYEKIAEEEIAEIEKRKIDIIAKLEYEMHKNKSHFEQEILERITTA